MSLIDPFGWNEFHRNNFQSLQDATLAPARITSVQGFKYFLATDKGELEAELSGKLLYGSSAEDLPRVGDWVAYLDYSTSGYVISVLPRTNALSRKNPGKATERQILCANVDYAMIVQGLDRDFNIMRLERYLAQTTACGITPVVVLNKSDLVPDVGEFREKVLALKRDCELHFCSTINGNGIAELLASMKTGRTYILIGSSGVGKSSLLNSMMKSDLQVVSEISDFNSKGRHTTTTRDLFVLPNGSLVIDSPGMREFGFTSEDGQDAGDLFPAIEELAPSCHYTDCMHINEPGCAVLQALADGNLNTTTYESYIKMLKEQQRFTIRVEDKKKMNRQFGKMSKEAKDHRKKFKY